MPSVYTHFVTVQSGDLDQLNHVNNVVYLKWVQEAAAAHWHSLDTTGIGEKFFWVVLRHEIDYRKSAVLNDEIIANTWVESIDGAKSVRVVQLIRKNDGRLLAEARTTWCLMEIVSGRPVRIGDDIRRLFEVEAC